MNLLALETSCERASVTLYLDGALEERLLEGHANHSEKILSVIHTLLSEAGLRPSALDAVAFGSGPGAFTGLRLSCGIAQGLALGAGIGVVPVCSLDALALQCGQPQVFAATDARMGEVYWRAYEIAEGLLTPVGDIACSAPAQVIVPPGAWHGIGSAFTAYPDVTERNTANLSAIDAGAVPRSREVAHLAAASVQRGQLLAPEHAAPLYVRDKVALTTDERLARGGKA